MNKKSQYAILGVILVMTFSILACFSTGQTTQSPLSPTATKQPTQIIPLAPSQTSLPIPTDTTAAIPPTQAVAPTATVAESVPQPVTGEINIIEVNSFKDDYDYWYIYGLVSNGTDHTVYDVQVEVKLIDSSGTEVYVNTTYTMLYYLGPGETSPFSDFGSDAYAGDLTLQAQIVGNQSEEAVSRPAVEFSNISLWASAYDDVYLGGNLMNNSAEPIQVNAIAGSLADEAGKLVTASSAYPFLGYIKPNGGSPFVMEFHSPVGKAETLKNYSFYVDVETTDTSTEYDIALSKQHYDYQDYVDYAHLVGEATNNTDKPMYVQLVAGIFDGNSNCIDAANVIFPVPLNPGESFPYDFSQWGALNFVPAAYQAFSEYLVWIDWGSTYEASTESYPLTTKNDTHTFDLGFGDFTGTVVNNSGREISAAVVNVALYEKSSGKLIATNYSYLGEALTENASADYHVYVYPPKDLDPETVNIVISAMGE